MEINNLFSPIYIEPFAGGAGLAIELLLKGDVQSIVINDFDKAIYSFWSSILYNTEEFIQLIEKTPINIIEWEKQKDIYSNQIDYGELEVGFATFFLNRTNRSGIIKGGPISRDENAKYKLDCRYNKLDLINKIYRISSHKMNIHLYNLDAIQFIKKILPNFSNDETFIFFDPPYYKQGKNLYTNFYSHSNHVELYHEIKKISNMHWITTYDYSEEILKIYEGIPKKVFHLHYSVNRKRKEKEYLFHSPVTSIDSYDKVQFLTK